MPDLLHLSQHKEHLKIKPKPSNSVNEPHRLRNSVVSQASSGLLVSGTETASSVCAKFATRLPRPCCIRAEDVVVLRPLYGGLCRDAFIQ